MIFKGDMTNWISVNYCRLWGWGVAVFWGIAGMTSGLAVTNRYLLEVPDYEWHLGCFGTTTGNLAGYWDRHGMPNCYTGPTSDGVAPLDSQIRNGNYGIRSLWASQAGA